MAVAVDGVPVIHEWFDPSNPDGDVRLAQSPCSAERVADHDPDINSGQVFDPGPDPASRCIGIYRQQSDVVSVYVRLIDPCVRTNEPVVCLCDNHPFEGATKDTF